MEWAGQTVSHYRVVEKLGGGGMGVVYEAEDLRLHRRVAIKFLPESLAGDEQALQRFQREARAASSLNHANICTIYEVDEHEGQPFIVMELMQGATLKERLSKGPLDTQELLDVAIDVCEGLKAAHSQGVIHRDVKPANIFVTNYGSGKLLDFGLAKLLQQPAMVGGDGAEMELSVSLPGVVRGTTLYMSPEQARGDDLDPRSDLFSLGAVLYEMATATRPFSRKNIVLTIDAILNDTPRPISDLNLSLPRELDGIIAKALEKQRESRYQTAAELSQDLKAIRRWYESGELRTPTPSGALRLPTASAAAAAAPAPAKGTVGPLLAKARRKFSLPMIIAAAVIVAIVIAVAVAVHNRTTAGRSKIDSIVVADFDNKTGDPVFDDTLKQALAVDLAQSPFLNVLSERKLAGTLRMMRHSPDEPIKGEVARELCQRSGGTAMLAGSISGLGNSYVIGLNAINCANGDVLVREQIEAPKKEDVLKVLGTATKDIRRKMGESLASVQQFATPIEEATTPSLEALKDYSVGRRAFYREGDIAAIPYYLQAVARDPEFAMAYSALAVSYSNMGQGKRSSENATKAFQLKERVSEGERYRISATYYNHVLGDQTKVIEVYKLWMQSYPNDSIPPMNLANSYMTLGQWQQAESYTRQSIHLEPAAVGYANLVQILLALNRVDEAQKTFEEADARNVDSNLLRVLRYHVGFLRGDQDMMKQQLAWVASRPSEENWLLKEQANTEAYFGRLANARDFSQRALESALRSDERETAAVWQILSALREAEFGNPAQARQDASGALALEEGRMVRLLAALAFARSGDKERAQKMAASLNKDYPQDSIVQHYWLPCVQAAIDMADHPPKAIEALRAATGTELGQFEELQLGTMYPAYLRGQAFLAAGQGKEAAAEFQKMIDHRGLVANFPLGALAHVGLARAYKLQGNDDAAIKEYDNFFSLWKDAGSEIPLLTQARTEYASLKH